MASRRTVTWLVLKYCFVLLLAAEGGNVVSKDCQSLDSNYLELRRFLSAFSFSKQLYVDPIDGVDDEACLNNSFPCRTLNYAISGGEGMNVSVTVEDIEVILLPGKHVLSSFLPLENSSMIHIHGLASENTSLSCAKYPNEDLPCNFDNLAFTKSEMIWISELTFTRCGPVPATLYLENVTDVIVENCIFENNPVSPVLIRDCDNTYFVGNKFANNHVQQLRDEFGDGRGQSCIGLTRDLFFYSGTATAGGLSISNRRQPLHLLIKDCLFVNNTARPNFESENIPNRLQPLGRGGGLSVHLIGTKDGHVCLMNSKFIDNRAEISGGGAVLTVAREPENCTYSIVNCEFENNRCETERCVGGALHLQTDGYITDWTVEAYNSTFRRNTAGVGAGMVIFTTTSQEEYSCVDCTFESNRAEYEGVAISVYFFGPITGYGSFFTCRDCHFISNAFIGGIADTPALYAYRMKIRLYGSNYFVNNTGGALNVAGGQVVANGTVEFTGNRALHGGALSLISSSQFLMKSGSRVTFKANEADRLGGAIYATSPAYAFNLPTLNRRCFLLYTTEEGEDILPSQWEIEVVFQDNKALLGGHTIYATNFDNCRFLGGDFNISDFPFRISLFNPPPNYNSSLTYLYENGTKITKHSEINSQLGTDAYDLTFQPQELDVALGETAYFSVDALDELLFTRATVFTVETVFSAEPLGTTGGPFQFKADGEAITNSLANSCGNETDLCTESTSETMVFAVQLQPLSEKRTVTVRRCYPGYKYDPTTSSCMCRDEEYEVLRCSNGNKEFYVTEGVWVGYYLNNSTLVMRNVPVTYLRCTRQGSLPGCLASFQHLEQQCALGRRGLFCAECNAEEGYGVTMNLRTCQQDCNVVGAVVLFVVLCIAVVFFSWVLLYFNIPVPNELRGFFLFAQVIGLVYRNTTILQDVYLLFVEFTVHVFDTSLPFPVCISPYISTNWMTTLGYIPPLLASLTVVGFIIAARYSSRLAERSSFAGIAFILLFVYKYTTDVSVIFLTCVDIPSEENAGARIWVNRFSGERCFGFPNLLWLIVALLLFLSVTVGTPIFMVVITCKHFNRTKHLSDALSKGLKHKARWFTAYDLLRRVYFILFALWVPAIILPARVLSLIFFEIFMLVFHFVVLPYQKKWINIAEGLILVNLFIATVAILQRDDPYFPVWLIVVVILLPFVYGIIISMYLISRYVWKKLLSQKLRERISVKLGPVQEKWMRIEELLQDKESEPVLPPKQDNGTSVFYVNPHSDTDLPTMSSDILSSDRTQPVDYRPELRLDTTL